ncbi:MAG: Tyrosine-protein kinase Wzc [Acidobacteriales bacterium]|nr:Tyrosine-protein kinase Wzc [Terriglobales bacterium]
MESSGPVLLPGFDPSFEPEQKVERSEKLWLLWRQRGFLWRVIWMTAMASTIVALLIPRRYQSTAKLVPGETSNTSLTASLLSRVSGVGGGGGTGGASAGMGLDAAGLLGLKTPGAFYVEILHSRTVQERLINKFDLRTHYNKKYYEDTRKKLSRYTDVDEDKKSGVITLSVTDTDKELAAVMVRAYVDEMNRVAAGLNTSAAHREREFLEQRLYTAKQDLDQAVMRMSQFSSKHTIMDVQQQGKAMMEAAAKLQGELIASESELKGLEQIYSDDNIRVLSLRARVRELQAQLTKMIGNYTDPSAAGAESQAAGSYPSIRTLPALGYSYADLYRQAKIQESVFDFLTHQYELARIQEARELPVIRVMDEGNVPEKKVSPSRSLIIALSLLTAFVLACVWVVEKERWNQLPADDSRRLLAGEVEGELASFLRKVRGRTR